MSLSNSNLMGFIPSVNMEISKAFYSEKLGLNLLHSDEYALEYKMENALLRVAKVEKVNCADYTVLGWSVKDIIVMVKNLSKKGVEFIHYQGMSQDDAGVCHFPSGSKVAWFKDPDGNTLSISQFGN